MESSVYLQKINNFDINNQQTKKDKKWHTKYEQLLNDNQPFFNMFYIASKHSGKSYNITHFIQNIISKKTIVNIFCQSWESDIQYINLIKKLKKHKIQYAIYESLINQQGENVLDKIYKDGQQSLQQQKDKSKEYLFPYSVNIFDDFNEQLKMYDKQLQYFIAKHRHAASFNIFSCQSYTELGLKIRTNMDIIIIFQGQSIERQKQIWQECGNNINFDLFQQLYNDATKMKYQSLVIFKNQSYRKNYNLEYIIN